MCFRGWNTEQLHEAWDVQSCLFMFKLVVRRKEWLRSLAFSSSQVCGTSWFRHGNPSWSRPLESMLVLGLYQRVSEPSQKWLSKAFIQRSVMPHQRLSKRHLLCEFPEEKHLFCIFGTHAYQIVHNWMWYCVAWRFTANHGADFTDWDAHENRMQLIAQLILRY